MDKFFFMQLSKFQNDTSSIKPKLSEYLEIENDTLSAEIKLTNLNEEFNKKGHFEVKVLCDKCTCNNIVLVSCSYINCTETAMIYPVVIKIDDGEFVIRFKNLSNVETVLSDLSFYYLVA